MTGTIEMTVEGMTCDHCVRAVTEAIGGVAGVTEAIVDLDAGTAVVTGEALDAAELVVAIAEEGYEAAPRAAASG